MKLPKELFLGWASDFPVGFAVQLDRMFGKIFDRSEYIQFCVRDYVDATAGAVNKYLPNGDVNPDKDYQYVKIDASVNTVTINAYTGQTINGAATYVLAAQYDRLWVGWSKEAGEWLILQ